MKLRYSIHARERMLQMAISEERVKSCLANPDAIEKAELGRMRYKRGRMAVVMAGDDYVVTVFDNAAKPSRFRAWLAGKRY